MLSANINKLMKITQKLSDAENIKYQRQIIIEYKKALVQIKNELSTFYENGAQRARLTGLINRIDLILNEVTIRSTRITTENLNETINFNYNSVKSNLAKAVGIDNTFSQLNPNVVNSLIVNNKLSGVDWRSKGLTNSKRTVTLIRSDISQGIIQGKSYQEVAKNITRKINIAASDALRIVKTETHRAVNEARILSINDAADSAIRLGYTPVKVWNGGEAFRRQHDSMNGVSIPVNEQFVLPSGNTTDAPGLTGDPADDVNCSCYLTFELQELQNV